MKLFNIALAVAFGVAACTSEDRVARNAEVDNTTNRPVAQLEEPLIHPQASPNEPAEVLHPSVGDDLYKASLADREKLVGARVTLPNAVVQSVNGDYDFWVGPTAARSVPVVLRRERVRNDSDREVVVRKGQVLAIEGTIQRVGDVIDTLKINNKARTRFRNQGTYISADSVRGATPHVSE
jgi:hypothetical protein